MRIAPWGRGLCSAAALLLAACLTPVPGQEAPSSRQRPTPPPGHLPNESATPRELAQIDDAAEDAAPPEGVRLYTGPGRLLYRLTVEVEVEARVLREMQRFGDRTLTFSGEVRYVQDHQPGPKEREGPLTLRTLAADFELLGLRAGTTALTGEITCKPRDDGSLLAGCGRLPEQWGLSWLPQIIWRAYAVRFPLAEEALAPAGTWGDTVTAVVGASQATMSVHGRLERREVVDGRPCAVVKGRFEARTRAQVTPGAEIEEVDAAHVGSWETLYDIESRRTLRQTGAIETVLMRPVSILRPSEPWISTTKVSFTNELVGEDPQPEEGPQPPGAASFARGWQLLAPPFVGAELDATPARNAFERAVQEDPAVAVYHESLALALARMPGQGGRALEEMRAALDLDVAEPRLHVELGVLLRGAHRWEEAAEAFAAGAEQDQYNALPLYLTAAMLAQMGDLPAAAERIREGNARRLCRFYLPPAPGLAGDPSRLGSALGAVATPTLINDVQETVSKRLREGVLAPLEAADTGRKLSTAQPHATVLAMAGLELERQALQSLELRDDPAAQERLRQLAALDEQLAEYRELLRAAQVMTVGFVAPAVGYAGGAPLALPLPLFLDEQAATEAALRAAFGPQALVQAGRPPTPD
ncbi:MAG: tetratricopeptide repeat protein [Armatimonadota bacterium]